MWIKEALLAVIGLSAGMVVAGGLFSFIIGLGVVSDFADRTHTGEHILLYEDSVALGGILGNIFWVYHISIPYGAWLVPVFGLLGGIFVGCWSMALAEILNVFPIFIRRVKLLRFVPYLILAGDGGIPSRDTALAVSRGGKAPSPTSKRKRRKEDNMNKQQQQEAYKNYVKKKTPVHSLPANMAKAFVTGGIICTIGQFILNFCKEQGLDKDLSGGWASMILILLSVLLTGFNIYPSIAKWGGAGALVPITGFANSVASPAIEYQKEGQVMGIGCKIFTIAGPVILYGIFSSWALGLGYWILKISGIL